MNVVDQYTYHNMTSNDETFRGINLYAVNILTQIVSLLWILRQACIKYSRILRALSKCQLWRSAILLYARMFLKCATVTYKIKYIKTISQLVQLTDLYFMQTKISTIESLEGQSRLRNLELAAK